MTTASKTSHADTPPQSPEVKANDSINEMALKIIIDLLARKGVSLDEFSFPFSSLPPPPPNTPKEPSTEKVRASKLAYQNVTETWKKSKGWVIAKSEDPEDVGDYDEYIFVVRTRIDGSEISTFLDIKSAYVRDILRVLLEDVPGISLGADMPSVDLKLLFHFVPELENLSKTKLKDPQNKPAKDHLDLLVKFIQQHFASTKDRLNALPKERKIEYDLLWALFKPHTEVFTFCDWTEKPMCVKYRCGEEKKRSSGAKYWRLECQYIEYNGKTLGHSTIHRGIDRFHGAKPLSQITAYPLKLHPQEIDIRARFIEIGRKFMSLIGIQHVQYNGYAIYLDMTDNLASLDVSSRVMVDAASFRKNNTNFPSRKHDELYIKSSDFGFAFTSTETSTETSIDVRNAGLDPKDMKEEDIVICSHLVYGFILNDKQWAAFAVANIQPIAWNVDPFSILAISKKDKDTFKAIGEAYASPQSTRKFDDILKGKGRGYIVLLHGPPGVGKTLTAESLAEQQQKPLYSLSVGQLDSSSSEFEQNLIKIFRLASH